MKKGYELIGWSSDLGKTIPDYKTGDIITIKEGVNYYSITKNLNPLVADFYIIDKCHSLNYNYCNHQLGTYNTSERYELNGGKKYFTVSSYEVYYLEE